MFYIGKHFNEIIKLILKNFFFPSSFFAIKLGHFIEDAFLS